jgi:hypothetical protein
MRNREPVSVLLPTLEWNTACDQLAAQLGSDDELLIICDTDNDPVAQHDPPRGVRILTAGEPEGCSGKANALACGMTQARHDRFVWTDDDFERSSDWLDRLVAAGETHGPASAIPFFTGRGLWRLFEPWYGALFTVLFYLQLGGVSDIAWGGGVTFTRSELTVSVPEFVTELRGVLSDDFLLTSRLPEVHAVQTMVMDVNIPGGRYAVYHRAIRFVRIVGVNASWSPWLKLSSILIVGGLLSPIGTSVVLTLGFAVMYLCLGLGRVNFLLSCAGILLLPLVTATGMVVETFDWAGRRYRFSDSGKVEILQDR